MNLIQQNNNEFEEYLQQFTKLLRIAENDQNIVNEVINDQEYTLEELEQFVLDIQQQSNKVLGIQKVQKEIKEIQNSSIKTKVIVVQNLMEKIEELPPLQEDKQLVQTWLNQYEQLRVSYQTLKQMLQK